MGFPVLRNHQIWTKLLEFATDLAYEMWLGCRTLVDNTNSHDSHKVMLGLQHDLPTRDRPVRQHPRSPLLSCLDQLFPHKYHHMRLIAWQGSGIGHGMMMRFPIMILLNQIALLRVMLLVEVWTELRISPKIVVNPLVNQPSNGKSSIYMGFPAFP